MSVIDHFVLVLTCLISVRSIRANELPFLHPGCDELEDPAEPTQLPHSNDCNKFYKCSGGYAFALNCPKGLHWSAKTDRCEYPGEAGCITRTQQTPTTTVSTHSTPAVSPAGFIAVNCPVGENPKEPTHLPYPGDCTKFFKCKTGAVYALSCPMGLHWSVVLNRCELPGIARCQYALSTASTATPVRTLAPILASTSSPAPTSTTSTLAPTPLLTSTPAPTSTTSTLAPTPLLTSTPAPTSSTSPLPSNPTITIIDTQCKNISSAFVPYPGNCNQYIQCFNSSGRIRSCPGNLFFNSKIGVCSRICA